MATGLVNTAVMRKIYLLCSSSLRYFGALTLLNIALSYIIFITHHTNLAIGCKLIPLLVFMLEFQRRSRQEF